jgi:hypothetical protein
MKALSKVICWRHVSGSKLLFIGFIASLGMSSLAHAELTGAVLIKQGHQECGVCAKNLPPVVTPPPAG